MPSGALRYELATRQWIDIFPDREYALGKLADTIRIVLNGTDAAKASLAGASPIAEPAATRTSAQIEQPQPATRAPIVVAGSEEFEAIRALLVRHVGPIAKVLVQKAAAQAGSRDDFCDRLATHIKVPAERNAFLLAAQARLLVKS